MKERKNITEVETGQSDISDFTEVKLLLPHDVARAWQRCTWIIANETEKKRIDIMAEMVRDFLVKHGC